MDESVRESSRAREENQTKLPKMAAKTALCQPYAKKLSLWSELRLELTFGLSLECGEVWRLMGFYGNPEERYREGLWELLKHLSHDQTVPWFVVGDFSEITNSFEKKGGRLRAERQMDAFHSTLEFCNLNDVGFIGRWFTWERGRFAHTNIRERLDRSVATLEWMNLFPSFQVEHLSHSFSDHCPLLLDTLRGMRNEKCNKENLFRFEAK
ncbi:hypothetical protein J1N35_033195 [Gossypium stocksii]|uniref:Endonuclease/exonuclease/phosphatase domain-containing protein n=1 Tax=Gossypium stocksii TaxID=47602 RepID=A0A9D3UQ67_9ROSI|nr:hypothetical protein J1N35_033195 [Gossypium stocksii]